MAGDWRGLDWMVLREEECRSDEGAYHRDLSAVVQAVGYGPHFD